MIEKWKKVKRLKSGIATYGIPKGIAWDRGWEGSGVIFMAF